VFLAKDFIETREGLVFAVVENSLENNKILCFLRYYLTDHGWKKLNTQQANQLLTDHYPQYLYFSAIKQATLHAVEVDHINRHHQPIRRLAEILHTQPNDQVLADCYQLAYLFKRAGIKPDEIGVTGSILIAAHHEKSDIDLVFYNRERFNQARALLQGWIRSGDCHPLTADDWQVSYQRRDCELNDQDYQWHERRKFNKAMINQRKFDLSLVLPPAEISEHKVFKKLGGCRLMTRIVDDSQSFDYPAQYQIDHQRIDTIISYTATYAGQAKTGERVEVSGQLEQASDGRQRIIVGSDREAKGEYIRVISEQSPSPC